MKWNEVTWYSRWGAIVLFLIVVPILCFYIGSQYQSVKDAYRNVPITTAVSSKNNATTTDKWRTYSNAKFSFQYPSDWTVSEQGNNSVLIKSPYSTNSVGEDGKPINAFTLKISAINKKDFQPVDTKVGHIVYGQDTLLDDDYGPSKCLPSFPLGGYATSTPIINYGGSTMSDPEYGEGAIITNKDDLILVVVTRGYSENQKILNEISQDEKEIYISFKLLNGLQATEKDPSTCARNSDPGSQ